MQTGWRSSIAGAAIACAVVAGPASAQEGAAVTLPDVVISTTPVPNAPLVDINKVPTNTTVVTSQEFERRFSPAVTDAITSHVAGAIALNIDGTDLSPDLFFRGYDVSRITGVPAGLAVYQNGVRINERFGDNVNLDLIPPISLASSTVYTANPIFGLNALGGAINFVTKNGFTFQGGDATLYGGSYGRVNGNIEYGKQVGEWAFYGAGDLYRDGGYRPFGAQDAERFIGDLGHRTQDSEIHFIGQYGRSLLGVQGVTPIVLEQQQYNAVFTTPQTTENQAGTAQFTARVDLPKGWVSNTNLYIRQYRQDHTDGNDADVVRCAGAGPLAGTACLDDDDAPAGTPAAQRQFITPTGPIPYLGNQFAYGSTAHTSTETSAAGLQQQLTNATPVAGHDNIFQVGGAIDASTTRFSSATTLGQLNAAFQNIESGFPGAGEVLQTAGSIGFNSVSLRSTREDYGIYALDTFNVTKRLAVTAGARYNLANIGTSDLLGTDPGDNAKNTYQRINPTAGATYEFAKALTIFGNYSETNRAPTPLETNCADPAKPCLLETALVSDPPLKQVVARTYEIGGRGTIIEPKFGGVIGYKVDYFHSAASDDIISQQSPISGQGYFVNVGTTLRQGVEAEVTYNRGPLSFYGNYAFVDATYQFAAQLSSPNNPDPTIMANGGLENVVPGDHIPGIPRNIGKLGFEYKLTPRFIIGSDVTIVGSQYYIGDDTNVNPKLPAFYRVDAHASYQVNDHLQLFVFSTNLTNNHYATTGTFYDTTTSAGNVNATLFNNSIEQGGAGDARAVTVAQPISFFGGLKYTF